MSYRLRLTLFFVLIVALPMIALAVLVSQIASDSANGKTDARISAGLSTATNLFDVEQSAAEVAARKAATEIAAAPSSAAALDQGDTDALTELARTLRTRDGLVSVVITDSAGATARAGSSEPAASAVLDLNSPSGSQIGSVSVSTVTSADLLERIESTTGELAALVGPRGTVTNTVEIEAGALPDGGEAADFESGDEALRVAATDPIGDDQTRIVIFAPQVDQGFLASRPKLGLALLIFFLVAVLAIGLVIRTLRGQVKEMLAAAKRLGEGDFSRKVPVSGADEMAGLATEFNKMSDRLGEQMDQLRRQRLELERSVRRVGQAFASGLDRQALLAILVEAAAGGSSSLGTVASSGEPIGALTVARPGLPFNSNEREVFLYLVGQAASSVENVALHELVSEQAVTDDLTALANKRAFRQVMNREAARAARFGHALSVVIVDIDDFKRVNDTYGHLQGDAVLRTVGLILAEESRGIDVAARYGGEEFSVALPETSTPGAVEVAERIRARIEAEATPLVAGSGVVRVTASLGVATTSGTRLDVQGLIASADAALYDAKAAGKNRVVASSVDGEASVPSGGRRASDVGDKGRAPARRK